MNSSTTGRRMVLMNFGREKSCLRSCKKGLIRGLEVMIEFKEMSIFLLIVLRGEVHNGLVIHNQSEGSGLLEFGQGLEEGRGERRF